MKYITLITCLVIVYLFAGCQDGKKVKVLKERDPMVKIIEEHDSLRVIKKDTTLNRPQAKKKDLVPGTKK